MSLVSERLDRQILLRPRFTTPAEVVAWFGAMQAQDYLGALWALGVRIPGATEATIEAAIAEGAVIRTHAFRGTWQYIAREDVRWMIALVGARVIASWTPRLRQLGLDARTLGRSLDVLARALEGGVERTRAELAAALTRARLSPAGQRLPHLLAHAELRGVIASGGRRGKQPTFALLDTRAPAARPRPREDALAELATRYFQSRGPATLRDLVWWSGLPAADAREAIELAELESATIDGRTFWSAGGAAARRTRAAHLLPPFDEYLIGYTDRRDVIDPEHARRVGLGGILQPVVVVGGIVMGTWRRTLGGRDVALAIQPFSELDARDRRAVEAAASRYARFLRRPMRRVP